MKYTSDVAFTDSVKRIQTERGSRTSYARMEERYGGFEREITPELVAYLAGRDSAYFATANAEGQPYVQHRGGRPGFIKVIGPDSLGFADFVGNRQYITTGNLAENERAFLFLMNYAERDRVKIWGSAHVVRDDAALFDKLTDPNDDSRVEQAIVFKVDAWDTNCSQHIPSLVHATAVKTALETLVARISYLESRLRESSVAFEPDRPELPAEVATALTELHAGR